MSNISSLLILEQNVILIPLLAVPPLSHFFHAAHPWKKFRT